MIQGAIISRPVASRHGIFFWFLRTLVKVRYTFFLGAFILGMRRQSVGALLVWVGVVFVAILLHELGHAFAAQFYRQNPQIELHAMGGETKWSWVGEVKWYQRIMISLAGPGIGFLVGGLLYFGGVSRLIVEPYLLRLALHDFLWVTLAWGVFNLLPLLPLDGGQALSEALQHWLGGDKGRLLARRVSCVTGVAGLVAALALNQVWVALMCGFFAFDNFQRMRGPGLEFQR